MCISFKLFSRRKFLSVIVGSAVVGLKPTDAATLLDFPLRDYFKKQLDIAERQGLINPDMYFIEICPSRGTWASGDVMVVRNAKISELTKWELDPDQLVLLPSAHATEQIPEAVCPGVSWQIWPSESLMPLLRRVGNRKN